MQLHSLIFDNFYNNPIKIRDIALSYRFYYKEELSDSEITDEVRLNLMNNVNYFGSRTITEFKSTNLEDPLKTVLNFTSIKTFYHLHLKDEEDSTSHRDSIEQYKWVGVIYLTPNPKPNSGTYFFNDANEKFSIENKFNRMILYDPTLLHQVGKPFGNTKESGRLAQVFGVL